MYFFLIPALSVWYDDALLGLNPEASIPTGNFLILVGSMNESNSVQYVVIYPCSKLLKRCIMWDLLHKNSKIECFMQPFHKPPIALPLMLPECRQDDMPYRMDICPSRAYRAVLQPLSRHQVLFFASLTYLRLFHA